MRRNGLMASVFAGILLLASVGSVAQTPVSAGSSNPANPAALAVTAASSAASASALTQAKGASTSAPQPDSYAVVREKQLKRDWPWLGHFAEENSRLSAPAAGVDRVVFMGDSITDFWKLEESFPGKPYINRGISGQTSPQMVLRFRQDVIDLKPKAVVILAGTNDIAGNTGPMTLGQTEANLMDMAELAHANGIRVVLCSVLPVFDFPWTPGVSPAAKIVALNAWIKQYAAAHGFVYVDYHTAMKDGRDGLPTTLSTDGVHPIAAGYAVMARLAEAGIEKSLGK